MKKRTKRAISKKAKFIAGVVNNVLDSRFKVMINDLEYRLNSIADEKLNTGRVNSMHLNLAQHILDGFAFTDNSPSAGDVAWTACTVVYKGTAVAITDGNTANKYIWWQKSASPNTSFQTSNTFPTLTDDDCLIAINTNGTHQLVIGDGRATNGAAINPATIGSAQIGSGVIQSGNIGAGQVASNNLNLAQHLLF